MDKLAKVRAEVEKLNAQLLRGACSSQIAMETRCKEEAYNEVLAILDTIQEEPVCKELEEYINELSKQFPEVSFAILSGIADMVSRWQQNQDVKNKLPKVTDRTELDEYAYQCAYNMSNDWAIDNPTWHDVEDACKLGAKWQKEQDQSTIELAEDHAMFAGMEKMKEQMMAKAIDAELCSDGMFTPLISVNDKEKISDIKFGDKVKVILLKK